MRIKTALFLIVCLGLPASVLARDDKMMYSIESAMSTAAAKQKLDRGFTYKFGDQPHGKIVSNHGEFMSNKKTNAFGKSDKEACEWVFLSAMLSFQDRIAKEGGNAVVNIRSYYKKNEISSSTEFECGAGAIMAGVTFLGDVVTLEQ
ncbi:MAG: excinuclease ABC subunit A [Halieaceae bacterium]|nr:excinuclease ABC subunit A [Halieaceae bacterium]